MRERCVVVGDGSITVELPTGDTAEVLAANIEFITAALAEVDLSGYDFSFQLDLESQTEEAMFAAAAEHDALRPAIARYVETVTQMNQHCVLWSDDENHAGAWAMEALAKVDAASIPLLTKFLRSNDMSHEVNQGGTIDTVIDVHGWTPATLELVAARATSCAGQHGREQLEMLRDQRGLLDYVETHSEEFYALLSAEGLQDANHLDFLTRLTPWDGNFERFEKLTRKGVGYAWTPVAWTYRTLYGADSAGEARARADESAHIARLIEAGEASARAWEEIEPLEQEKRFEEICARIPSMVDACRPLGGILYASWSFALWKLERYSDLIAMAQDGLQDTPIVTHLLNNTVLACIKTGRASDGIDLWRKNRHRIMAFPGSHEATLAANLIAAYATEGRYEDALADLEDRIAFHDSSKDHLFLGNVACLYAHLGRREDALRSIEAGLVAGQSISFYEGDSDFDGLRNDPAFQTLLDSHR